MRTHRRLAMTSSALVAALSVGCAAPRPTHTGFIAPDARLVPTDERLNWGVGLHRVEAQPIGPQGLAGVESFYVEPVTWLAAEDDWLGPNDVRRQRVSAALDSSLRGKLGQLLPIVDAPGPRSARVRAAVTQVKSARPVVNALASTVWGPVAYGGASVEAEILGPDGHRLAAASTASQGGILDILGCFTRSGHPKKAARRAVDELVEALMPAAPR